MEVAVTLPATSQTVFHMTETISPWFSGKLC